MKDIAAQYPGVGDAHAECERRDYAVVACRFIQSCLKHEPPSTSLLIWHEVLFFGRMIERHDQSRGDDTRCLLRFSVGPGCPVDKQRRMAHITSLRKKGEMMTPEGAAIFLCRQANRPPTRRFLCQSPGWAGKPASPRRSALRAWSRSSPEYRSRRLEW